MPWRPSPSPIAASDLDSTGLWNFSNQGEKTCRTRRARPYIKPQITEGCFPPAGVWTPSYAGAGRSVILILALASCNVLRSSANFTSSSTPPAAAGIRLGFLNDFNPSHHFSHPPRTPHAMRLFAAAFTAFAATVTFAAVFAVPLSRVTAPSVYARGAGYLTSSSSSSSPVLRDAIEVP